MRIVGKKTERKTNISLFLADIHTYKLFMCYFFMFFLLHLSLTWLLQRICASGKYFVKVFVLQRRVHNGRWRPVSAANRSRERKSSRTTKDRRGAGCHEEAWRDYQHPCNFCPRLNSVKCVNNEDAC